ncbi:MAG: hypothetical protein JRC67_11045 [Deltaproteobacteria bacterium]|nr:hypothetical protein [Deltaproteobacteria bacterium]
MKESLPQKVSVTAVVDNYLDVFEPSTSLVERAVPGKLKGHLLAGHGLAYLVDISQGESTFCLLMAAMPLKL